MTKTTRSTLAMGAGFVVGVILGKIVVMGISKPLKD